MEPFKAAQKFRALMPETGADWFLEDETEPEIEAGTVE